ncbi:hypothetical protein PsorP6_010699 [Peronosclerospora sorghi]|uniref:Uncharacterized protein n=1 Tax=Peronosclerospora sorghi TaxID=230839 RepID=A0ACC0VX07_9STRA|nr:hypothetical protein PsorP6_010699 [Peronosclerospora sorghi]
MQFESQEHKGFALATKQQFDDFLPRFCRHLVLMLRDRTDPTFSFLFRATSLIDVACYDIHRRPKTFRTETIGARLQLAAVCAQAGTTVPCKRLEMTGAEDGIQMLRSCRSSRPFSEPERDMLSLGYRKPAVKILARKLLAEADRLAFLFDQTQRMDMSMGCIDEESEY